MKHPLQEMMDKRRQGIRCGIPSYCSANELVIEIALRRAKERSIPVLIEATANQVNQFGGYTGMKPADFYQLKPIWEDSFFRLTDSVIAECRRADQRSLILRCKTGISRIDLDQLLYCEVLGRTAGCH